MNHTDIEEREQEALNSLEDAKERIRQLEEDLRDMTKLAVDYKEANTRLEDELREFHAKDGGRTREHNLLVQENRKLREALNDIACHPKMGTSWEVVDCGESLDALVDIAREALKPAK